MIKKILLVLIFGALSFLNNIKANDITPPEAKHRAPNDCVILAANKLAVLEAKNQLNPQYKSKLLIIESFFIRRIPNYELVYGGHALLIYRINGKLYAYDEKGTLELRTIEFNAEKIANELVNRGFLLINCGARFW